MPKQSSQSQENVRKEETQRKKKGIKQNIRKLGRQKEGIKENIEKLERRKKQRRKTVRNQKEERAKKGKH